MKNILFVLFVLIAFATQLEASTEHAEDQRKQNIKDQEKEKLGLFLIENYAAVKDRNAGFIALNEGEQRLTHEYNVVNDRTKEIETVNADGRGNIVYFGYRALRHETHILGNASYAGIGIFLDGKIPRGLNEAQASVARGIDVIAGEQPKLLKLYNIKYSELHGYYFYNYQKDMVVLGEGNNASRVILPCEINEFKNIFQGIQSEYPIIYEENLPMIDKMTHLSKGMGFIVLRGVGFVELEKDIIQRLYDLDEDNGTTHNIVVEKTFLGEPILCEKITQLEITVNSQRHEAAGSYLQLGLIGKKFYEIYTKNKYAAHTSWLRIPGRIFQLKRRNFLLK